MFHKPFPFETESFTKLLTKLRANTAPLDAITAWPTEQFQWMADAGVLGWGVPAEFGGSEFSNLDMTAGYQKLSSACMLTTFVLTQQNGACQRVAGSSNAALKARLLPAVVAGEYYITVGISHLTTSSQHLRKPAVQIKIHDNELVLNGTIPWVTGANHAKYIISGGTCADGRQLLVALPTETAGIEILPAVDMLAMSASQTGAVQLNDVRMADSYLIAGPVENVMQQGVGGGTGSLTTSALAIGSTEAAVRGIAREAANRADIQPIHEELQHACATLLEDMLTLAG